MADSFVKPHSGIEDSNVMPKSGGVAFDIPLFQLKTTGGGSFPVSLNYRSALQKEDYETWTHEAPENPIGVGWGMNTNSRIFVVQKHPIKYGLYLDGMFYLLKATETKGLFVYYKTITYSLLTILYDTAQKQWSVFLEDGTEFVFGRNDAFTNEKGTYSPETGTYTQASEEYTAVRALISSPNSQNKPASPNADNTISRTTETTLFGLNNWVGPTYDVGAMAQKESGWLLSHVRDSFDNTISFSYIQHISTLVGSNMANTYSVASYLYRISVFCKEELTEKIVLQYQAKDTKEFNVDFIAVARPNGNQQRFEKLYLTKLSHYLSKFTVMQAAPTLWMTDQVKLNSRLLTPTTTIVKRQLTEIQFLAKDTADVQYQPSYVMDYYGSADGVSIGDTGFNDTDHLYFNAKNGALYGALKKITYPTGESKSYQYAEHDLNSVFTTFSETLPPDKEPIIITTPYDYSIMIVKNPDQKIMTFYVLTMTAKGWVKQTLSTRVLEENYDYERLVTYSEHVIGFIAKTPGSQMYIPAVFSRSREKMDVWSNVSAKEFPTTDLNKMALHVSDYGFAYAMDDEVYYRASNDYGISFGPERTMTIVNLVASASGHFVALNVLEGKCLVFVMSNEFGHFTQDWIKDWIPSSIKYETFWMRGSGLRSDGTLLPLSDIGEPHYFSREYYPTQTPPLGKVGGGFVFVGHKVEKFMNVEIRGNLVVLNYKTRGRAGALYHDLAYGYTSSTYQDKNTTDWSQTLFHFNDFETFRLLPNSKMDEALVDKILRNTPELFEQTTLAVNASSLTTENGTVYNVSYSVGTAKGIDSYKTAFVTYLGGSEGDFLVQKTPDTEKNLLCVAKDNTFAVFQSKFTDSAFGKTYYYLNTLDCTWHKINTGSVTSPSITYNHTAETVLNVLYYIGLVLFIVLLPFGLGSVAGVVMTVLSVGLAVAGEVASSILQKSYKASLNLESAYYGNRFINDGTTIWFRESRQDRLTAVGGGESYQPHDSLSGGGILGNIVTDKQQFGNVYNFVPFFTDKNRLYYRTLKNDAVGAPIPLGGLSVSCNDLYYHKGDNVYYAYKDNYKYTLSASGLVSKTTIESKFRYIDAICPVALGVDRYLLTISGSQASYSKNGAAFTDPKALNKVVSGSSFTNVDCALEIELGATAPTFYLFSGNRFELAEITSSEVPFVVSTRGTLAQFANIMGIKDLPFDKFDAAYYDNGICLIRNNRYVKYALNGEKKEEGRLGNTWFQEELDPKNVTLGFTGDILYYYKKKSGEFQMLSTVGGNINTSVKNYAVDTVSIFSDPRIGTATPTSTTKYRYYTDTSTYMPETGTGVYSAVDVSTTD